MSTIWAKDGIYKRVGYDSESDLEAAILQVQSQLFGQNRIYLDVKRKIGAKGGIRNIPDGYVIDLNGREPRLYVVENELASHDPLRHIAVQILQFSLSFESEPHTIKKILLKALQNEVSTRLQCEEYAVKYGFRNLDHLLDVLVFETPFAALVIIDEMPPNLQKILAEKFKFGVDTLELVRYQNTFGENLYQFEPFLADLVEDLASEPTGNSKLPDIGELDTVVVPAREEGFKKRFLNEDCWFAIRIHGTMRPQIKYIAAYQVAPISAITHIASVKTIEPYEDTGKFIVYFSEQAQAISPIALVKNGRVKALQNIRYTSLRKLESAKTLDDVW